MSDDLLGARRDVVEARHHLVVADGLARDRLRRIVVARDDEIE